jgi:uncharacterized protein (DUF849 family)
MVSVPFLQAALNGDSKHPAAPRTAARIAQDARSAIAAGAQSVHIHAFNDDGNETLDGSACAKALRAIRRECPEIPISLTTSATIVEDPLRRLEIVSAWTELPDLVTANQGEEGIVPLCELLLARGVELEAGLLSVGDARKFVASAIHLRWRRVLIEPLDADPGEAVRHAAEMEHVLAAAGIALEQVHHGYGIASWAVNRRAIARGHGIRTGLEDVTVLPDGREAASNAQLVQAGVSLIGQGYLVPHAQLL